MKYMIVVLTLCFGTSLMAHVKDNAGSKLCSTITSLPDSYKLCINADNAGVRTSIIIACAKNTYTPKMFGMCMNRAASSEHVEACAQATKVPNTFLGCLVRADEYNLSAATILYCARHNWSHKSFLSCLYE